MTASPPAKPSRAPAAAPLDPITWAAVGRTLVTATGVAAFLSYVGAFGTRAEPFVPRTLYMIVLAWIAVSLGLVTFRLVVRLGWGRPRDAAQGPRRYLQGMISALLMTGPMGVLVWSSTHLMSRTGAPLSELGGYVGTSFVMCQALTAFAVSMNRRAYFASLHLSGPTEQPPPKFLERLPLKLRGAEVWAVEAEDHYLRLHTSLGQDLILLRLADAVDELAGIEGAQVHRSWWVARDAIADARRGDGRATLVLKDGSEVPVSRTYAKILREQGWM